MVSEEKFRKMNQYVARYTKEILAHDAVIDDIVEFADTFTPEEVRKNYSYKKFKTYWTNRFLDHVLVGMKHPVVDKISNSPIHPVYLDDAITYYNIRVVEGTEPEYRFPNHNELIEYAVFATLYDVMKERLGSQLI